MAKDSYDPVENEWSKDAPAWWKLLHLSENEYYISDISKRPALNNYQILKEIAPNLYEVAGEEVKEFNEYHRLNGNSFNKVKLGKKLGSVTLYDFILHPELATDPKALRKYWQEHPELRAERYNKYGNVAKGPGFNLGDNK